MAKKATILCFSPIPSLILYSGTSICINRTSLVFFISKVFRQVRNLLHKYLYQFSSVAQLCPTLCDPMNCSMAGLPVQCQLLEFTQSHVHWVGDAIQPSHPLSSPSHPAFNLSQHQGLFKSQLFASGGQSIGVSASASVLPMNTQD